MTAVLLYVLLKIAAPAAPKANSEVEGSLAGVASRRDGSIEPHKGFAGVVAACFWAMEDEGGGESLLYLF